jgi:hypothetical protein
VSERRGIQEQARRSEERKVQWLLKEFEVGYCWYQVPFCAGELPAEISWWASPGLSVTDDARRVRTDEITGSHAMMATANRRDATRLPRITRFFELNEG